MFCKNCGKELEENWMICPNCGEKIIIYQGRKNTDDINEPVRNSVEKKEETDINLIEKREINMRVILKILALVAFVCLFCPLYMVSCAGQEVCSISGLDMTLGFQVMGEDIDGNWLYGLIAILPLSWFLSYNRKSGEKGDVFYTGPVCSGSLLFLMISISAMLESAFESEGMLVITSCTALVVLKIVCIFATGIGGYLAFLEEVRHKTKDTVNIVWTVVKCAGRIIGLSILLAALILGVIQYFAFDKYKEEMSDMDSYNYLSEMDGDFKTVDKEQSENIDRDNVEKAGTQDVDQEEVGKEEIEKPEKTGEVESEDVVEEKTTEYIFPNSDSEYLIEDELWKLSAKTLKIGRNEIFARHGYIFKDKELQEYFESTSWYKGIVKGEDFNMDTEFNEYEKANAELIKSIEETY